MSKAFTKESDDEQPVVARPATPAGKDYLTPGGAQRLRDELAQLTASLRSTTLTYDTLTPVQQTAARARIVQLEQILAAAEVVPAPAPPWDQVLFGATVTVRDAAGKETQYRIVGREEADLDRDWVAWTSPIARALLKARLGQQVRFRIPAGEQIWEIARIAYE